MTQPIGRMVPSPTSADDVFISATASNTLGINTAAEVNHLVIESGVNMSVASNYLEITGDLTNNGSITVASGASLVLRGTRSGSGTETINRNLRGGSIQSMVGSPVSNATIGDLGANDVFQWNTAVQSFSVPDPTDPMTPGQGFFVNGTSPSLTGEINDGQVDVAVIAAGDAFNLIANPYSAAIDANAFFTDNNAAGLITGGQAYIWNDGGSNDGSDRNGDFLIVNSAGSAGASTPSNNGDATGGVKNAGDWNDSFNAYQGFYVETTTGGTISFLPSQQVTGTNSDGASFRDEANGKLRLKNDQWRCSQ